MCFPNGAEWGELHGDVGAVADGGCQLRGDRAHGRMNRQQPESPAIHA